jgi:NTE family protein
MSDAARAAAQPVRYLPTDDPDTDPEAGIGLCLSGGGYRAMLFHVGALWRLNEAGWLSRLDRISSVSGGSIAAAVLGLHWPELTFAAGVASDFETVVVPPLRDLAGHTVDEPAIAAGLLSADTIGERVSAAYRDRLFGDATLQDLPDEPPRFVINATNLASGVLFRFSKDSMADHRVGTIDRPQVPLADAVAASSAFPPVLSPFTLDLRDATWRTVPGNTLTADQWRGELALTDGGVYDNLGLETVWKRCRTVLVSDAGGQIRDDADPPHDWLRQSRRVLSVVDNQVRDLRKRQIKAGFGLPDSVGAHRDGAYWGIRSDIRRYAVEDPMPAPHEDTLRLAEIPTRLKRLDADTQERLINWGYAITDAALRRWVKPKASPALGWPYPQRALG